MLATRDRRNRFDTAITPNGRHLRIRPRGHPAGLLRGFSVPPLQRNETTLDL
jgi:hypothetical protein